ncbi:hypothetical protein FB465_1222 [Kitasatospora atroaurantiaca]|uniref:Uncharacterized protein n=1 Tax=Kitasatospora atroaurantiaca TaxID=285545 RepID=A0A561EKU2_9ACTN|nr:hypothetical protein FB465_1222 [Kitasatospora atroaurantiaca]
MWGAVRGHRCGATSRRRGSTGRLWSGAQLEKLPGPCLPLVGGGDSRRLLHLGRPDSTGEYPVPVTDIDGPPPVAVMYPGPDVYLADLAGVLDLDFDTYTSPADHPEYGARMRNTPSTPSSAAVASSSGTSPGSTGRDTVSLIANRAAHGPNHRAGRRKQGNAGVQRITGACLAGRVAGTSREVPRRTPPRRSARRAGRCQTYAGAGAGGAAQGSADRGRRGRHRKARTGAGRRIVRPEASPVAGVRGPDDKRPAAE